MGSVPAITARHGVVVKGRDQHAAARQVALNAYPSSKIVKEELEREGGGSGLRYSFDMKQGQKWREVGVDAMSGKVPENKAEGTNPKD
jgi:uncharacterized membrane protein YkoI